MLHCGDNLEIMRGMESGSIDLIATDPPFNTGKDWGAFNDKWEGGMKGYLKFMEPRLVEIAPLAQGDREYLSPLRPKGKPLPQGYDGHHLWHETL